jgi:hypothetical protein
VLSALEIADNTNDGISMFWPVAVQYKSEAANGKSDVQSSGDSKVV